MYRDRVRLPLLFDKVMNTAGATDPIQDGTTVDMSGFIRAGETKAAPQALVMRAKERPLRISLMISASLGNDLDKQLTEASMPARRMPFQTGSTLCKAIDVDEVVFIGQHLSEIAEQLHNYQLKLPDIAVIEAATIIEQGHIVPIASVGNLASFAILAKQVIVEVNLTYNTSLGGLHDIYILTHRPIRMPIPLTHIGDRIDNTVILIPSEKIVVIVINNQPDSPSTVLPPDGETQAIVNHLIGFFKREVSAGHTSNSLDPLQADIGSTVNAMVCGLIESSLENLTMYSEVLQDSTFGLIDAGKLCFASGSSITLSPRRNADVSGNPERYKDKLVSRPQEIFDRPEVIHRLGIIGINTALEFDTYSNANSAHVGGTKMMNSIGGSGGFAHNAHLTIFATESIAKGGNVSSVVPMVSHISHIEYDVDILVTEQGLTDLRGLAPRERTRVIIKNCVHPSYQAPLLDYFEAACTKGDHAPHLLHEAPVWHPSLEKHGHILAG